MEWYQKKQTKGMVVTKVTDVKVVLDYLASTDWYVVRKAETDTDIPQEVLDKRVLCRSLL